MYLNIHGERLISDVQKDFSHIYPFLKIEFFRNGMNLPNCYPRNTVVAHNRLVKDAWCIKKDKGLLKICDNMTVADFEKNIREEFGLSAQVFRRFGRMWLKTTITDNLTLKQQNDHGKEITSDIESAAE